MTKILVTGAGGQLGNAVRAVFDRDNEIEAVYTDFDSLDITDAEAVERAVSELGVDFIVNCAAYTAVDKAESDEVKATAINSTAVGILGEVAAKHRAKVIHVSTDYVFSGENYRPYEENDEPYPQGNYGRTKLDGEGRLLSFCLDSVIIRTAWLYSEYGANFVKTMLTKGRELGKLKVVADQIGTPTYAGDLAQAIYQIVKHPHWTPGIYHYSNEGVASWYDFAKAIFEIADEKVEVEPIPTSAYPTPAKRPHYSVLNKSKIKQTYGIEVPYWRDSLKTCIRKLK